MVNLRFTCSNCKNNIKSTTQSKGYPKNKISHNYLLDVLIKNI